MASKYWKFTATTVPLSLVPAAWAHTGEHGAGFFATLWHMVSQPDHLAMAVGVGVMLAIAWKIQKALVLRKADDKHQQKA